MRTRVEAQGLDRRPDLMPRPYAAKDTVAADFGDAQRASWTLSVLTDAPVVVYAVSGWADGRTVDTPQPAEDAMESGATTAPAQAGLGHEAQGLADPARAERGPALGGGLTDVDHRADARLHAGEVVLERRPSPVPLSSSYAPADASSSSRSASSTSAP